MPDSKLPWFFLLLSVMVAAAYMGFRPWPQSNGKAIRPAAYTVDIFKGDPPAGTPPTNYTGDIQTGLYAILTIWAVSKAAGAASTVAGWVKSGSSALGTVTKLLKGLGSAAEDIGDAG